MVCQSPLRATCSQPSLAAGYLYRRSGTIVRKNDRDGVSCRSSVCTLEILQQEVSHWKMGDACRAVPQVLCDGKEVEEKCHKWNLPILEFVAEEAGQNCLFTARWEPTRCDRTHCVIALTLDGQDVTDFSVLPENVRISLNNHLKREGKK
jgi:hypothetical protein